MSWPNVVNVRVSCCWAAADGSLVPSRSTRIAALAIESSLWIAVHSPLARNSWMAVIACISAAQPFTSRPTS
jgi:hypothetical protein